MEYAEVDASIVDHAEARLGLRVGAARKQEENGTVSKQQHVELLTLNPNFGCLFPFSEGFPVISVNMTEYYTII